MSKRQAIRANDLRSPIRARLSASGAWRRLVIAFAAVAALLGWSTAASAGEMYRSAGGVVIYLGVLPAAMLRGHSAADVDRTMHGGEPARRNQWHVVVALFDEASGARIENAVVTARVGEPGLAPSEKRLEPMPIADAMSYGNYFSMRPGTYRIDVRIIDPPTGRTISAGFPYVISR